MFFYLDLYIRTVKTQRLFVIYYEIRKRIGINVQGCNLPWTCRVPPGMVPYSKLDFKRLCRFKILEKISNHAYKLDLPAFMKCNPVLHISLLEPTVSNPLKGQKRRPPPPIIVNDEQEYEAEEVVDSKLIYTKLYYQVQ